jgi:hypothetical protein
LNGLAKNLTGGAESLLNSAKGIAGSAFAAIKNSFPKLSAGVPQNLKQIAEKATAAAQNSGTELAAGVAQSANAFNISGANAATIASGVASSAVSGAAESVTNLVTGTGAAVTTAAGLVTAGLTNGANSLLPASVSTGLGALPGAQKAVASIVNNAKGALNIIPGTSVISAALGQVTAALGSGGSLGNVASGLLSSLKNPGASLQALAAAGLPAGAAASLNSAISSLSSGGALPIKLPVISTNTVDRTAITAQIGAVFGSTKIPVPNYSGNPASTGETASTSLVEQLDQRREKIKEFDARFDVILAEGKTVRDQYQLAIDTYVDVKNNLPAGDPGVEEAKAKAVALGKDLNAIKLRGYALLDEKYKFISSSTA